MSNNIQIISPVDGSIVAQRELAGEAEILSTINAANSAQKIWKQTGVQQRAALCHKAIDIMRDNADELAEEITRLMGRPVAYSPGEIRGLEQRARYMIDIAGQELADIHINGSETDNMSGLTRLIRHEPLGTVLVLAPWNYPYLTAVNSIIPALMAGNSVILKHSKQTLLCAERFHQAFIEAGLPAGVFQYLHLDHKSTSQLIKNSSINFVSFTGSVSGGKSVELAAAGLFKGVALELGGKDPAYVMSDADLDHSVENLVDGAFFNSGQSCCAVERIYVHADIYDPFVEQFVETVKQYRLGPDAFRPGPLHVRGPAAPQTTGCEDRRSGGRGSRVSRFAGVVRYAKRKAEVPATAGGCCRGTRQLPLDNRRGFRLRLTWVA